MMEALRDFVMRTPFEQQRFDCGALFSLKVHEQFAVPTV
jgi:hypothetical protein